MNLIEKYSNKEVPFRFNGVNLSFFLSQSLFSSYSIDNGTKLLLKTIAKEIDISKVNSIADVGCGVGVIGLSLKKKYPLLNITLQDRDALAISFSKENARRNKIKDINYNGDLALEGLEKNSQDLIISNLPAKAGETVLQDFINRSLVYLSVNGICIVVIVASLKDTILNAIRKTDAELIYTEDTREYSVFHFKKINNSETQAVKNDITDLRECYIRDTTNFKIKKLQYTLKSVYNIPGFDTVPYHVDLTAHLLEKQTISGRTLFWNPEQGHLPLITHLANRGKITETVLASRDILQLKISKENLLDTFGYIGEDNLILKHICCPEALRLGVLQYAPTLQSPSQGKNIDSLQAPLPSVNKTKSTYDSVIISLDNSDETIMDNFLDITEPIGILIITGKSSNIATSIKNNKGWIQIVSRKYRGFRVVVFKKNSQV
ncbi:MAG: methyltransferase [Spirochaetales bacterium]|nr:methyltransferase [Spirochaetales bacterium]